MSTLIMWQNGFSENENEAVEAHISRYRNSKTRNPRHRYLGTKTPWHQETETNKPRHRDSKVFFQRTRNQDIKIPRLKTTTSRLQDQKRSSFWGILTLMPLCPLTIIPYALIPLFVRYEATFIGHNSENIWCPVLIFRPVTC